MNEQNAITLPAEYTALQWAQAPRQTDPDYANSIYAQLDLSAELCPACGAHLSRTKPNRASRLPAVLICLNGCHMGSAAKKRMQQVMRGVTSMKSITDLVEALVGMPTGFPDDAAHDETPDAANTNADDKTDEVPE